MTELHQTLAELARDHGEGVFRDADAFRGALDDYLDEGAASTGTINLLTDAVRLGALQGMLSMLDSGANPDSAVDSAGQRLARDRGSADVTGSRWAVAVLGAALGRVPASLATRLRPDAITAQPGPTPPPTAQRPPQPAPPPPVSSPPQGWPSSGQQSGPQGSYGAWQPPSQQKKSRTGLIVGLAAVAVLVIIGLVIGLVALAGGDEEDPSADDPATSASTESTSPSETGATSTTSAPSTSTPASPTGDPARTFSGDGYSYTVPTDGWTDVTKDVGNDAPSLDTIVAWGETLETARGNVLVEKSSAFGETDVDELVNQWKQVLQASTGAKPKDYGETTIGGERAVGVVVQWTNPSNVEVRQVAYLVVHGENQYSITGSSLASDEGFEETFNEILATWQWH